jgi:hypothetical protein
MSYKYSVAAYFIKLKGIGLFFVIIAIFGG